MTDATRPPYSWNIPHLLRAVEAAYASDGTLERYWDSEKASVEARLDAIRRNLSRQFAEPSFVGVGGAGIVLRMIDKELGDQACALKFPRPVPGQTELLTSLLDKEIHHLATLRHTSIVRIHRRGTLIATVAPPEPFPYYVMDFVSGQGSSAKYVRTQAVSEAQFIHLVASTIDALAYMHSKETAHLDLKPDNILVNEEGVPVIADLGTAKKIAQGFQTMVACTYGYVHPELASALSQDPSDPNRIKGTLVPSQIKLKWDLYSLGKTILHWIGYGFQGEVLDRRLDLSPYARKYFLLLSARLLDGHVDSWLEDRVGLDRPLLTELRHRAAADALLDVKKLSGEFSLVDAVPELNSYHPNTLQIAADSSTTYSDRLKELIHHPLIRRLSAISQLGLVNQVYPTATHSRLEHSVGTYHNACRCVLSLYYDPFSPLFRQIVAEHDIRTLLVAAVLHDIGQYPLAHDLEEIGEHAFDHRALGYEMLSAQAEADEVTGSLRLILKLWDVTIDDVVQLLEAHLERVDLPFKTRVLHSIIDGPLDADKLDYLRRDSERLRVPYAFGIDEDRILRSLTVIVKAEGKQCLACIGVHEKGRVAAEFVAVARYALFSQAYWQHTVRCMKGMLSRAVWRVIVDCQEEREQWQKHWSGDFKRFVAALPGAVYGATNLEPAKADRDGSDRGGDDNQLVQHRDELPLDQSSLTAMDASVVRYFWVILDRLKAPEAELLVDLARRALYKRLFVFSEERHEGWHAIVEKWEKLSPTAKLDVLQTIEQKLAVVVADGVKTGAGISTVTLQGHKDVLLRREARRPFILIDVPASRPGASVPLYYVVEAQRRALRKDERAVGEVEPSAVWQQFGNELRERAGKVRVFVAPDVVDVLEATVTRKAFVDAFDQAVRPHVKS